MSLASFLLDAKPSSKKKGIDTELDALFRPQSQDHTEASTSNDHPTAKRKQRHRPDTQPDEPDRKRSKPSPQDALLLSAFSSDKKKNQREKRVRFTSEKPEPADAVSVNSGPESLDEDGDQPPKLIHETVQREKLRKTEDRKAKYAPSGETKERRDARTIFIGNLGPDVAVKRPLQKQLRKHMLAFVPTAKIESIRFRSVAFNTPTSKLPEASDEGKKHKQLRKHELDRASSWRDANPAGESKTDEKKFLTPDQKKKIAFINKNIHSDADSVHAYIVFAYPQSHSRPANLPPLPPVMNPFDAARQTVEKCNGTMFLDRILRVDTAVNRSTLEISSDSALLSSVIGDSKLSVFVGNLDFASKEEDLRVFFEGLMSAERGPPDAEGSQNADKPRRWVTRVRMIRDKDTQLGKGFAYVQFSDRTCVDEILALEPGKLIFAKRKLRVLRCRSVSSMSSGKSVLPSKSAQTSNDRGGLVPSVPKGDPSLGEKLVELSKEDRKRVKAADVGRVARRMAKKKARMALAKQGLPSRSKPRERVRKTGAARKDGGPNKVSKGRVRSERSIAKRNAKK